MEDGSTLRDHLKSEWRQNQYRPDLEPAEFRVECPEELRYLWEYFRDMGVRRDDGGCLPHSEVEAWQRRRRIRLDFVEEQVIDALEQVFQSVQAKHLEAMRRK